MRRILAGLPVLLTLALGVARGADEPVAADKAAVVRGGNRFALELYARLRPREGNRFLSPYSISTALAMTSAGARGETAAEMARTLHLPGPQRLHPAMARLMREVNRGGGPKRAYQLSTVNALWGEKGYPFRPAFLEVNRDYYGAGLYQVDFAGAPEQARRTINAWVEKQTQDKIKELLPEPMVTSDTRLVLTNAIYFKSAWRYPFDEQLTRKGDFRVTRGKTVRVPLMGMVNRQGGFKYLKGDSFRALEMPYAGEGLSLVIFLPDQVDGLSAFERSLTAGRVEQWLGKLRPAAAVHVILPRFQMASEFDLKEALTALGMRRAFEPGGADLSGINGSRSLFLSAVVHKAFVDVNEQGTEAAAAAGVGVGLGGPPRAARPLEFRADRPFLFLIRDTRSDGILFLGRLADPSTGERTAGGPGRP